MSRPDRAVRFFFPEQRPCRLSPIGAGNVNDTWKIELASGEPFILQRLSPAVFPDPGLVMTNLERVTHHLHRQLAQQTNPVFQVPQLLQSPAGKTGYMDDQGACWRMLSYIDNSRTLLTLTSLAQAEEIGKLLGCFHSLLSTLPPEHLHNPLPGFHVTPDYLHQYDTIRKNSCCTNEQENDCLSQIERYRQQIDILERNRKYLTTAIIHGDPKAANFLFARESNTAISLIDLDTVMPGLLLHDLGDCLRSCCNPAGEDIDGTDRVSFSPEFFSAVLRGYIHQGTDLLNTRDQELLIDAIWLICFELGLRFFTDHLAGNCYFKVQYPEHNLHRARIQFKLAESVQVQRDRLDLLQEQIMMAEHS